MYKRQFPHSSIDVTVILEYTVHATKDHQFWKAQGKKPDCFIFHDVDLLPEDLKNLYGCFGYQANHMCDKFDKYQYKTQYTAGLVFYDKQLHSLLRLFDLS